MESSSSNKSNDMVEYSNDTLGYWRGCGRATGHGRGGTGAAAIRMKKKSRLQVATFGWR